MVDVNGLDGNGRSALMLCGLDPQETDRARVDEACATIAQALIARGAQVDLRDSFGWAPIDFAAAGGLASTAALLVAHGGDAAALDEAPATRRTPLMKAAAHGHARAAAALLRAGADANARDDQGATALSMAVRNARRGGAWLETLRVLLGAGADADIADAGAVTPLMRAARQGDAAVVAALLQGGASPGVVDANGMPAASWAVSESIREMLAQAMVAEVEIPPVSTSARYQGTCTSELWTCASFISARARSCGGSMFGPADTLAAAAAADAGASAALQHPPSSGVHDSQSPSVMLQPASIPGGGGGNSGVTTGGGGNWTGGAPAESGLNRGAARMMAILAVMKPSGTVRRASVVAGATVTAAEVLRLFAKLGGQEVTEAALARALTMDEQKSLVWYYVQHNKDALPRLLHSLCMSGGLHAALRSADAGTGREAPAITPGTAGPEARAAAGAQRQQQQRGRSAEAAAAASKPYAKPAGGGCMKGAAPAMPPPPTGVLQPLRQSQGQWLVSKRQKVMAQQQQQQQA
ncbi:ankyrin repeat-containing domain protein [Tribonema minus]|uniref:Ankyrin repeat-containing domain protein n=1 Tax=Tribonema minus TaxID=303371 RepID=A0A835Z1K6_9STRA|nr:ankyrin repeat-containing domain protein [Tribonema minus]